MEKEYKVKIFGEEITIKRNKDGKFIKPGIVKELEKTGTGLKPAYEPIIMAMKPLDGTYVDNALKWGVAGLNIDEARIPTDENLGRMGGFHDKYVGGDFRIKRAYRDNSTGKGRFPANLILECICDKVFVEPTVVKEPEVVQGGIWKKSAGKPAGRTYKGGRKIHTNPDCPAYMLDKQSGFLKGAGNKRPMTHSNWSSKFGIGKVYVNPKIPGDKGGGASRFFYCAKASRKERTCNGQVKNDHPTVKPLKLMEYLCVLTKTPTGGIILDPFAGSGTTLMAAKKIGRDYIGIEKEPHFCKIAEARLRTIKPQLSLDL